MRVAALEVSHWHTPMYLNAVRDLPGRQWIAVSDKRLPLAQNVAAKYACKAYASSEQLLDAERPDFVFIFGEHADMPSLISLAIDRRIPFCVEKPAALNAPQLRPLAQAAERARLFNACCYVYRTAPLARLLLRWRDQGRLGPWTSLNFKYLTGPPQRYAKWNCPWVLDPARSGGGTTIILSVHYVDLLRLLTGEEITHASGHLSSNLFRERIDDHSHLLLRTQSGVISHVETGFTAAGRPDDMDAFEFMTEHMEIAFSGAANELRWWDRAGASGVEKLPAEDSRAVFVQSLFTALDSGAPPPATLRDALAVLQVLDQAKRGSS